MNGHIRTIIVSAVLLSALAPAGGTGTSAAQTGASNDARQAAGFHELFMHDECIGENVEQPDTCLHLRQHEKSFTFGGRPETVYEVTLRIRGLFEPTTMVGGDAPDPRRPYFVIGGQNRTLDYSRWHIDVSEPARSYTLNHYPSVSHTIYKEDFETTIPIAGGAKVVVQVIDGNDRQIDNGAKGRPDRQQTLEGVVDAPRPGQMLRIDVVRVAARAAIAPQDVALKDLNAKSSLGVTPPRQLGLTMRLDF